jgi:hypothetical protein
MKIFNAFVFLLLTATLGQAQTLQFGQVKLVTSSETVPANKVWKVESVLTGEERYPTSGTTFPTLSRFIVVNGANVCIHEEHTAGVGIGFNGCCGGGSWLSNTGQNANSNPTHLARISREATKLPIWLPAGTTLAAGTRVISVSVIEFNVIP